MMMIYETRGFGIVLKESRLAVNNDKKQMMCLASKRKRAAMAAKGEAEKMRFTIEGHKI